MPHILVEDFKAPKSYPIVHDNILFEFGNSDTNGSVGVKCDGFRFLLRFFPNKNGTMIKYDKNTRIPNINTLKRAILAFSKLTSSKTIYSNLVITKPDRNYSALKKSSFLSLDHEYKNEIWVEIGFGSGRHILHNSHKFPHIDHIGIEVHKPSIEQLLKQCEIQDLHNIYVFDDDARIAMETIRSNSVSKIFIHFPVPWDKSPHRRVINKAFVDEAIRILKKDGTLELRTDSKNYFDFVYELLSSINKIHLIIKKNSDLEITSKYESRWKKLRKDIYDLILINQEESLGQDLKYDFSFSKEIPLDLFLQKIPSKGYIDKTNNFLYRVVESQKIDDSTTLIKMVLGKFSFPEPIYFIHKNNTLEYYPREPYYIRENIMAHNHLKRALEIND